MTDPRCTCGPSILDPLCPVEEHRTRAAMAGLRSAGARSGFFDVKAVNREGDPHIMDAVISINVPVMGITDHVIGGTSGTDDDEPTDGGCE